MKIRFSENWLIDRRRWYREIIFSVVCILGWRMSLDAYHSKSCDNSRSCRHAAPLRLGDGANSKQQVNPQMSSVWMSTCPSLACRQPFGHAQQMNQSTSWIWPLLHSKTDDLVSKTVTPKFEQFHLVTCHPSAVPTQVPAWQHQSDTLGHLITQTKCTNKTQHEN